MTDSKYIGRFAPSPTGLLHLGSLIAAMTNYCPNPDIETQFRVRTIGMYSETK